MACGPKGPSRTLEYYFTYDPRSLDPAFSTDVPTGEVDALLFDNLTQFDVDGRLVPGLAKSWEVDPTGVALHLPPPHRARHSTTAARSAPADVEASVSPRALAQIARWAPLASIPHPGRAGLQQGRGRPASAGIVVAERLDHRHSPSRSRSTSSPSCVAMPATGIVPTPTGRDVRPVSHRQRPMALRRVVARRRHRAREERRPTGDRCRSPTAAHPHHPRAAHPGGGVRARAGSAWWRFPSARRRRWEARHGAELQAAPDASATSTSRSIPPRGPLSDVRVRQALNLADRRAHAAQHASWRAAGSRHTASSRPASPATTRPARPIPYDPDSARTLLAAAGHAERAHRSSSGARSGPSTPASRRRCSRASRRSASRWRSSSATRRAPAPPCGRARPTSSSPTGTPTIPIPRTSPIRCSTRGMPAPAGTTPS